MVTSSGICEPFTTRDNVTGAICAFSARIFAVYRRRLRASSSLLTLNMLFFTSDHWLKFGSPTFRQRHHGKLRPFASTHNEDALCEALKVAICNADRE